MKQYKAGHVKDFGPNVHTETYYTDDFESFYSENDVELDETDLRRWAFFIVSPWDDSLEGYEIEINLKDGESDWDEEGFKWRCIYSITGYDGLEASIIGYGDSEETALEECKNHLRWLCEKELIRAIYHGGRMKSNGNQESTRSEDV